MKQEGTKEIGIGSRGRHTFFGVKLFLLSYKRRKKCVNFLMQVGGWWGQKSFSRNIPRTTRRYYRNRKELIKQEAEEGTTDSGRN